MKNTRPKVSIIVPVYNAGNKLTNCIETLINQTLKDIEIICILDCPTDNSDRLIREYAKKDNRIIILDNSENIHIGLSRNRGLDVATGEYIGFSDHDDYRVLTMYEELYDKAKEMDADLVIGISSTQNSDGENSETYYLPNITPAETTEFLLRDLINGGNDSTFTPYATNIHPNLYKSTLINNNNIRFIDSRISTPEDRIFQIMCLSYAQQVSVYNKPLYYHLIHSNSEVNNYQYTSYQTRAFGKLKIFEFLNDKQLFDKYKQEFFNSTKKEFVNCIIEHYHYSKKISETFKVISFFDKFPFTRASFHSGVFSTKRYRTGGSFLRKCTVLLFKVSFLFQSEQTK